MEGAPSSLFAVLSPVKKVGEGLSPIKKVGEGLNPVKRVGEGVNLGRRVGEGLTNGRTEEQRPPSSIGGENTWERRGKAGERQKEKRHHGEMKVERHHGEMQVVERQADREQERKPYSFPVSSSSYSSAANRQGFFKRIGTSWGH